MAESTESTTLGELIDAGKANVQTGPFGSQLHSHEYVNAGVPVVATEAIGWRRLLSGGMPRIAAETAERLSRHRLVAGDIVFARRGAQATGLSALVEPEHHGAICGTGALRLRIRDKAAMHPEYISFALIADVSRTWLRTHAVGAVMPNLNEDVIRRLPIRLPPLPEQRAIAAVLGTLDDKIEVNRKTARVLEGIARAVFTSWFVDFDPVRRHPHAAASSKAAAAPTAPTLPKPLAALFPTRLVDSAIGEVPEGWRVAALSEIVEVIDCLHTKKPERTESGRLLLQLANIRDDGLLDLSDQYLISEDDYARWGAKFETQAGDCVITNVGRVGAVAQIPKGVKAALGRNMTGLRPRSDFPYPTFLIHALLSESLRREIVLKTDSGTILDALNVRSIGKLRVVTPPAPVLKHFEMRFRPLRERVEHTIRQSATLAALRDALLPKLISGELRIADAEKIVGRAV